MPDADSLLESTNSDANASSDKARSNQRGGLLTRAAGMATGAPMGGAAGAIQQALKKRAAKRKQPSGRN
jgi:hypothetical protein